MWMWTSGLVLVVSSVRMMKRSPAASCRVESQPSHQVRPFAPSSCVSGKKRLEKPKRDTLHKEMTSQPCTSAFPYQHHRAGGKGHPLRSSLASELSGSLVWQQCSSAAGLRSWWWKWPRTSGTAAPAPEDSHETKLSCILCVFLFVTEKKGQNHLTNCILLSLLSLVFRCWRTTCLKQWLAISFLQMWKERSSRSECRSLIPRLMVDYSVFSLF